MKRRRTINILLICILLTVFFCGCSSGSDNKKGSDSETGKKTTGTRSNTPHVLIPEASGTVTCGNELVSIDASNTEEGYVIIRYLGNVPKVKLLIEYPDGTKYWYRLHNKDEVFPLTGGDGTYTLTVYENVVDDQYATTFNQALSVKITDEFGPFLYPNQFVDFNASSEVVLLGKELAKTADTDLDVVTNIYNYVINNITYDTGKAKSVQSGYVPAVDDVLNTGTGICFDYASVMASMLRSQRIPTQLEVGYAGTVYHAWISVHIDDIGWVNGIIQFDGSTWKLMDPTFAASNSEKDLKKFIGDGSNYETRFVY